MIVLGRNWAKFKQELIPIVCLSIIQVWWSFTFPVYKRLGTPFNTILAIIVSFLGIAGIAFLFLFADKLAPRYFNLAYLNGAPNESILKYISVAWSIITVHLVLFLTWYYNFCNMPSIHYIIQYAYCVTLFVLLYRASHRYPSE